MEKFKAVFTHKDCGNYIFTILKSGDIICPTGREVGFHNIKDIKIGDACEIEKIKEGDGYYDNPYCRIVNKIDSSTHQRLKNLMETLKFTINEFYTTESESKQIKYKLDNGVYYFEDLYFMSINGVIESIIKFFSAEKKPKLSKMVKEIYTTFNYARFEILGIEEGSTTFYGNNYNYDIVQLHLKKLKKEKYSLFTSYQKIVSDLHEQIKSYALVAYEQIEDLCVVYDEQKER